MRKLFNRNKRPPIQEIDPDEIFLDSSNLPDFDVYQFEGRIEKSIPKKTVLILGVFFIVVGIVFMWRIGVLQIKKGETFVALGENNRLKHTPIFPERGVVYDRNNTELIWNKFGENVFSNRAYIKKSGLAHILGFISYPATDKKGIYYQTDFIGKDGIEKFYNDTLSGSVGLKIVETNALSEVQSESVIRQPVSGEKLVLSIDSEVQNALYRFIENVVAERGFEGGAGVIMGIEKGEILALTSFPEYSSTVLSEGDDSRLIASYQKDNRKPFLNKVVSGLYTPGSIVKPFIAIGALNENIITPEKKILSTGSISIPNPYFPELKSVFKDWRAQGWVDVRDALAVSSNVYFYEIGGGFKDQKGLGIEKIEEYVRMFGLGERTKIDIPGEIEGIIPNPKWKADNFNGEPWRIGDTYHTSIGQYGFQITPIQMVRAIAAIANSGKMVVPHVSKNKDANFPPSQIKGIDEKNFRIVREGMRQAVVAGTAKGLNIPQISIAAKTGTAEIGISKKKVNSWIVGFFPYENPKFAFTIVMEKGPRKNTIGGLYVMRQLLEWMILNKPEYLIK